MNSDQLFGQITAWNAHDGAGKILDRNGKQQQFFIEDWVSDVTPRKGQLVSFESFRGGASNRRTAFNVSAINPEVSSTITSATQGRADKSNFDLLKEVANWKLDANSEDLSRYFLNISEVTEIEGGNRSLVIGRKGTGKTAIANHLAKIAEYNTFAEMMSFKNFPFNELYHLTDSKYTPPNQYITAWKFIIYSSVLRMMMQNEQVDSSLRSSLSTHFQTDLTDSLASKIKKAITSSIKLGGWGFTLEVGKGSGWLENSSSLIDRVEAIEKKILAHVDDARYFIIFDALDDDYRPSQQGVDDRYWDLLTSLVKAVQDVRRVMRMHKKKVFPVVFIRDDIYSQIRDADKTKWMDDATALVWHKQKLQELLAFRISRSASSDGPLFNYNRAWLLVSNATAINKKEVFDFIWNLTHSRPRDFIKFLSICARYALTNGQRKIHAEQLMSARTAFSRYLALDIQAEAEPVLPDIHYIYAVLSDLNKPNFKCEEFVALYEKHLKKGQLVTQNAERALSLLYDFNVVGNIKNSVTDRAYYKYLSPDSTLSLSRPICIHPGFHYFLRLI